jgi:hypothetical protein
MTRLCITAAAAAAAGFMVGFVAGAGLMAVRLSEDEDQALFGALPLPPRRRADREGVE